MIQLPRWILLVGLLVMWGCQTAPAPAPTTMPSNDTSIWRDNLPELAKGHSDKIKLALYAGSLLRKLDPPVKDYITSVHDQNKRLATRLAEWAKGNHVDLDFHYTQDPQGKAREAMEKGDGDSLKADSDADFQRDVLRFLASDYDWQRSLASALLPYATDSLLKGYLEDSLRVDELHYRQALELLKRYHWTD